MRIQVELKRDAVPQVALNKLFKHTPLQSTFGVNTVALVNGVPKTLSLLELLTHYLDFQREIVTRRSKHELRQKEKRAHILQGYLIALDNLDAVIALIRASADTEAAKSGLMTAVRPVRAPGGRDPRAAPPRADRSRAEVRSRTSTRTSRSASPSCATCSAPRRRSTR